MTWPFHTRLRLFNFGGYTVLWTVLSHVKRIGPLKNQLGTNQNFAATHNGFSNKLGYSEIPNLFVRGISEHCKSFRNPLHDLQT